MRYLNIWQKLFAAFALVAAADVLAVGLLLADRNEAIAATDKQREGLAYLAPLWRLRALMPEARRMKAAAATSAETTAQYAAVELVITRLNDLDLQLGPELHTTEDFLSLKKAWDQLQASAADPRAEADLAAKVDLATHSLEVLVPDTSGLVLDSVLDTFYLIDASVLKLTGVLDRLDRLVQQTRPLFGGAQLPQRGRDELIAALTLLREDVGNVESDLKVVTDTNPALKNALEEPTEQFKRSVAALLTGMDDALGRGRLEDNRALEAPLADARMRTFTLYDVTVATLDERFKQRRNEFVSSRNRAGLSVALVAVAGMAIAYWIGASTASRIRRLTSVVRDVASGGTGASLDPSTPDEIGMLVGAVTELVAGRTAPRTDTPIGVLLADRPTEENLRLKVLVADLSLENQQLRASGGSATT